MFIAGAMLLKSEFPKEDDLCKQQPKEAIESAIKTARKVANREAKDMRIWFIEQNERIGINNPISTEKGDYFNLNETNTNHRDSILEFLKKTTDSTITAWPSIPAQYLTTVPLLLITNTHGEVIFDEDNVCYRILNNPNNNQISGSDHKPFESGYAKLQSTDPVTGHKTYIWEGKRGTSSQYFTIHASGLCDSVSFKGENCPDYNHNFTVNSLSGVVTQI
jgi:hypothetical protein